MDITPDDFMDQAEEDLERGGDTALLNALTSAKRAIHAQVDQALGSLGLLDSKSRKQARRFDLFGSLGFVAPRVLSRVTELRNVLEHEYRRPTLEQVHVAVDLAALFVEAAARHLRSFDVEFTLGNDSDILPRVIFSKGLRFEFDGDDKEYEIHAWNEAGSIETIVIPHRHPMYIPCVRLSTAGDRPSRIYTAIGQFITAAREPGAA